MFCGQLTNRLPLNVSKYKVLDIVTESRISCSDFSLSQVDDLKILGATFFHEFKMEVSP